MAIGHQQIIKYFKQSIKRDLLAHAYLFFGPAHLGKKKVALEFIQELTGADAEKKDYPDVLMIQPLVNEKQGIKKEAAISINQIKQVQHQMSMYPYELNYKVAIIQEAEKMTMEAANCLLKTLEEPIGQAIMILISSRPQQVLPTVSSRCQRIKFLPVPDQEIKQALNPSEKLLRLANGRPGIVLKYLENPDLLKEREKNIDQLKKIIKSDLNFRYEYIQEISQDIFQAQNILNEWRFWFRDLLLANLNCQKIAINQVSNEYQGFYSIPQIKKIIDKIEETSRIISNSSFNARLALEALMLDL